jgi:rod shape determining protein RodA
MKNTPFVFDYDSQPVEKSALRRAWNKTHLDLPLLVGIFALTGFGLFVLYSASNQDLPDVVHQLGSFGSAFTLMVLLAQIPPHKYRSIAPWLFTITAILLVIVLGL